MTLKNRLTTLFTIILNTVLISAQRHDNDEDDHHDHHDYNKEGYTFVIDDLMWLVLLVVSISLFSWLCCCMDPMFTSPQPCCKPCAPPPMAYNMKDPVVHVRIDQGPRQYTAKNVGNISLNNHNLMKQTHQSDDDQSTQLSTSDEF